MQWLVQSNLIKEEVIGAFAAACASLGHTHIPLKIIPFSDSIEFAFPPFWEPPKGQFIPYGSTSMIKLLAKARFPNAALFFNEENLRTSTWSKELGKRMLNHDARIMTLKEAMELKEGSFFMKPDNDLKDFTGSQVSAEGIRKFYEEVSAGGFTFGTDIRVVICPLKNTGWEYRNFMIKDRVISSSSYKLRSLCRVDERVPEEVIQFAEENARIWRPDDVYVQDIVETEEGLKVVEFNCFNGSGFYNCDLQKVVDEVSRFVQTGLSSGITRKEIG